MCLGSNCSAIGGQDRCVYAQNVVPYCSLRRPRPECIRLKVCAMLGSIRCVKAQIEEPCEARTGV